MRASIVHSTCPQMAAGPAGTPLTGARLVCARVEHVVDVLPQLVLSQAIQIKGGGGARGTPRLLQANQEQ